MKKQDIIKFLYSDNEKDMEELFNLAFEVRKKFLGDEVWIRGLVEFSNYCVKNCLYCGLRRDNYRLTRYRMSLDEIVDVSKRIIDCGIKTVVLQSGDDWWYNAYDICDIIRRIKEYDKTVAITLSIGERKVEDYKLFFLCGADRYLLKHETSNEKLYKFFHNENFEKRKNLLLYLKNIGYQIGSGNIIGLPGQTLEDLFLDIMFLKNLDVDMAAMGPFLPSKYTPLAKFQSGSLILTLKVLAISRILLKNVHLPLTTATISLAKNDFEILKKCFLSGTDVVMINFTDEKYIYNYKIYDNRKIIRLDEIKKVLDEIGLKISFSRGDSFKKICNYKLQKV